MSSFESFIDSMNSFANWNISVVEEYEGEPTNSMIYVIDSNKDFFLAGSFHYADARKTFDQINSTEKFKTSDIVGACEFSLKECIKDPKNLGLHQNALIMGINYTFSASIVKQLDLMPKNFYRQCVVLRYSMKNGQSYLRAFGFGNFEPKIISQNELTQACVEVIKIDKKSSNVGKIIRDNGGLLLAKRFRQELSQFNQNDSF